jgi:hypothetical protein
MKINAADIPGDLIKADIVESFEAGPGDRPNLVVRHKEVFFPPHEDMFPLSEILAAEVGLPGLFRQRQIGWKPVPVLIVYLFGRSPFLILGAKCVFGADHLSFEVGSQRRMVLRQAFIPTQHKNAAALEYSTNLEYADSRREMIPPCQHVSVPPVHHTLDGQIAACHGTCCLREGKMTNNLEVAVKRMVLTPIYG